MFFFAQGPREGRYARLSRPFAKRPYHNFNFCVSLPLYVLCSALLQMIQLRNISISKPVCFSQKLRILNQCLEN